MTITQRAFDDARSQSAVADVPRAKRIVEQLNAKRRVKRLSWKAVLALAHSQERDLVTTLSTGESTQQAWLTDAQIAFALQYVARRLDNMAPSVDGYDQELRKMRAERIPVDELRLPSHSQIISAMARKLRQRHDAFPAGLRIPKSGAKKSATKARAASKPVKRKTRVITTENAWQAALILAGLQEVERASLAPRHVSSIELLDRCWEVYETQLTQREARIFARANNIPYALDRENLIWSEALTIWKQGLKAHGIDPPKGPPPIKERPDYSRNVGAGRPGERLRRSWTDMDALLSLVITYLKQVPGGERSSYAGFTHWMRAQGKHAPGEGTMYRLGGWSRVRKLAQERMHPGLESTEPQHTESAQTRAKAGKNGTS